MHYRPSNYNHALPYRDQWLIFNGVTSALVMLDQGSFERLQPYLFGLQGHTDSRFRPALNGDRAKPFTSDDAGMAPSLRDALKDLIDGKYIVEEGFDELGYLRERYETRKHDDPLLVTVVTTMDCNLGCYYCYEEKYPSALSRRTCDRIFDYIAKDLKSRGQNRMHLGWFGGEPMLNQDAIDYLSARLLPYCSANHVRCTVSMVSNGTMWPEDAEVCRSFVIRNRIGSIQFSFDGLPRNHNNRRHYKDGNSRHGISSFDALCRTIEAIRGLARLYLRLNIDSGNKADVYGLVDEFRKRGWLAPNSKIYPYLAALGPYTDACHSVERNSVNMAEFDLMDNEFCQAISEYIDIRQFEYAHYPPGRCR